MNKKEMKISIIGLLLLATFSTNSFAECLYNGQKVEAGTKVGGYKCQSNGEWVRDQ